VLTQAPYSAVVESGKVSGFLDFEFSARDWRAMELAICLSKYVGEPEPLPYLNDYIAGFAEGGGVLNEAEVKALPALINLRVLSNVVYFVGRALAGEDDIKSLTSRAEAYAARVRWVNANGPLLQRTLIAAGVVKE
jgi:Ser/Thr protein kinase RdoA (MazF antagonist)